ncbi:MAG TPA: hypothetical protein PK720_01625 [bacterium]|jgi:hypothetical protein|nr:hypothetical protein [bacterium]
MQNILSIVKTKLSSLMWTFIVTGILLVLLAVISVWTDLLLRLLMGLTILLIAFSLFSVAHKIHSIRKHLD